MDRVRWLEDTLRRTLQPLHLQVTDESALHAGHPGAAGGGGHFRVLIVCDSFRNQSLLIRQRAVYAAVGDAMQSTIHALALTTLTPEEWSFRQGADGSGKP
jgi:BolA family transcriptional regulator, general stress-responsive regulator